MRVCERESCKVKIDQNIPQETKVNHNRPKSTATGQGEPHCTVWFTLVVAPLAGVLAHFGHWWH